MPATIATGVWEHRQRRPTLRAEHRRGRAGQTVANEADARESQIQQAARECVQRAEGGERSAAGLRHDSNLPPCTPVAVTDRPQRSSIHRAPHRFAIRLDTEPPQERERPLLHQHSQTVFCLQSASARANHPWRRSATVDKIEHERLR